jgi:hypothetical protein
MGGAVIDNEPSELGDAEVLGDRLELFGMGH